MTKRNGFKLEEGRFRTDTMGPPHAIHFRIVCDHVLLHPRCLLTAWLSARDLLTLVCSRAQTAGAQEQSQGGEWLHDERGEI